MPRKTDTSVVRTIGIDTGKNALHMVGLDERGAIVLREKVSRHRIAARLVNVHPCLIGIEAGMATHYVARELLALGHDVKQVPPTYAKPFRQGHKNDFRDAYAVAEAVQRPSTRCVPIKTDDQLDLQALHRVRSRLIGDRTAVINQLRGFLLEHGIAVRQGYRFLRQQLGAGEAHEWLGRAAVETSGQIVERGGTVGEGVEELAFALGAVLQCGIDHFRGPAADVAVRGQQQAGRQVAQFVQRLQVHPQVAVGGRDHH